MRIADVPFTTIDWEKIEPVEQAGDSGTALVRTVEMGNVRVRMVEYSAGYSADHWCSRGHVALILEGEAVMELSDGRSYTLHPGTSFQVADDVDAHRCRTETGAKAFVVD